MRGARVLARKGGSMDIRPADYTFGAEKNLQRLADASFLNSLHDNAVNTMIIGWGALGNFWRLPMLVVAVQKHHFTHKLISEKKEFSVTVPDTRPSQEVLDICGLPYTQKPNKLMLAGLSVLPGRTIKTPVIAVPGTQYECRVVFSADALSDRLDPALRELWYKQNPNDYHTLFFGEIVDCYTTR